MNSNQFSIEDQMMKIILEKWISKSVYAAAKIGVADVIRQESKSVEEIGELTGTRPDLLYRMLRALSGVGIFVETADRTFANTPLSECLAEGRLKAAALMFHSPWHDGIWGQLAESLHSGEPAFEKLFGLPVFDWIKNNPEEAAVFHATSSRKAATVHGLIADAYDFTDISTLVDVGGGTGGLMVQILQTHAHLKGMVAELPETVDQLHNVIKVNRLEDRMSAVGCDFFVEIPRGADAYLLSHILHDWPDEECGIILKNCRKAMGALGKLLLIEGVISSSPNTFSINNFLDLEVFLMGGGRERTEDEYRHLLTISGFQCTKVIPTQKNISIIEASVSSH